MADLKDLRWDLYRSGSFLILRIPMDKNTLALWIVAVGVVVMLLIISFGFYWQFFR